MDTEELISPLSRKMQQLYLNHTMCYNCGALLFKSQQYWAQLETPEDGAPTEFCAARLYPAHRARIAACDAEQEGAFRVSSCHHCHEPSKARQEVLFEDYGQLPEELAGLCNYHEKRLLSLGNLYCRTFWPTSYAYVHIRGTPMTR